MRIYRSAEPLQAQAGATWLDGLTEVCGWMGRDDDVRRYGVQSLERADVGLRCGEVRVCHPAATNAPSRSGKSKDRAGDAPPG